MSGQTATEEEPTTTPEDAPQDANVGCVGPTAESAGKSSACAGCPNQGACSSGAFNSPEAKARAQQQAQALQQSLDNVSHVILVLSGKGGVGKSTLSAQLTHTLASQGYAVGLLDVDLCGPSAPRMVLGDAYKTAQVTKSASGAWLPVYSAAHPNMACMSISFLLQQHDSAVVWRGPRKNGLIQQFLTEVDWTGETDGLDYLIVDTPPGTSDEHISTVQYLQQAKAVSGAVIVTTPEEVSLADVRKEINFCEKTKIPILGLVENMGELQLPLKELKFQSKTDQSDVTSQLMQVLQQHAPDLLADANVKINLFPPSNGGPKAMAQQFKIPYWGILPMDPQLLEACENGKTFVDECPDSAAAKALSGFCQTITKELQVEEV
jgi:Mrp family chromosome partitioning ATPase